MIVKKETYFDNLYIKRQTRTGVFKWNDTFFKEEKIKEYQCVLANSKSL